MTKIFFPYNDQPKKFSFVFSDPIHFPFYVNNFVYYWEVASDGVTMYLLNNQPDTPIVKDVLLEETGITMYLGNNRIVPKTPIVKDVLLEEAGITTCLVNDAVDTSKRSLIEFAKIGWGIDAFKLLDPLTLGTIDPFTLGDISIYYANWMNMTTSIAKPGIGKVVKVSDGEIQLHSNVTAPLKDPEVDTTGIQYQLDSNDELAVVMQNVVVIPNAHYFGIKDNDIELETNTDNIENGT